MQKDAQRSFCNGGGKEVFLGKWLLYAGLSMNKVCNARYSRKVGGKYCTCTPNTNKYEVYQEGSAIDVIRQ
jgi:hypothetical protein